ncbi:Pex2 / Pex12 amino terminal region family protein [Perkinsela sp. CCAP 1560/4]|nr:Pex2 / Pex12 amino terminal region family protein [Perkinsela sp. CCAP 1560/4]|eukprot:KNH09496.1 Pex2 / Pex12 amino terminal region family protein [Perkinsela sp. CCAP 1560/4]
MNLAESVRHGTSTGLLLNYLLSLQHSIARKNRNTSSSIEPCGTAPTPTRADRFEGHILQGNFVRYIKEQMTKAFEEFNSEQTLRKFTSQYSAELESLLHGALLIGSLRQHYGDSLVNLRHRSRGLSTTASLFYVLLKVGLPYAIAKSYTHAVEHRWIAEKPRRWRIINILELSSKILFLADFLLLQLSERYRGILDFLFGMQLEYGDLRLEKLRQAPIMLRTILFGDLLGLYNFYLPILTQFCTFVHSLLTRILTGVRAFFLNEKVQVPAKTSQVPPVGEIGQCSLCHDRDIQVPVCVSPCQHKFCYYCIMQEVAALAFQDDSEGEASGKWDDIIQMSHGEIHIDSRLSPKCPQCEVIFHKLMRC